MATITDVCEHCQKEFTGEQRSNRPMRRYCSRLCAGNATAQKPRDRFMRYVLKTSEGCWLWQGPLINTGYGIFRTSYVKGEGKLITAHRYSFELSKGPIAPGMFVCHSCDVRRCVNPAHLWLGTNSDNIQDAIAKGRFKRTPLPGERNGCAKLTNQAVETIRTLYSARGGISQAALAKMFGIAQTTVSDIVNFRSWCEL